MPAFDIDIEILRASLQQASLAGIGVSFLTGLVFSFNPVSFASIPVVLAYVTKARELIVEQDVRILVPAPFSPDAG
ncbi:MAG: hypothetical protein IIA98_05590 [Proteobacteria bacterium]|nr:hypothetical protein [Pseudomonadota bacterium]